MMMTRMSKRKRKAGKSGLTLVEMLVVVAGLTLLLAILLPALDRSQAQAQQAQCVENLYTLGSGLQRYYEANRALPAARYLAPPIIDATDKPPLSVALLSYLQPTLDMFHCPGDEMDLYFTCGMSYYYFHTLGGLTLEQATERYRVNTTAELPLLWDGDNTVYYTDQREAVAVPPFHDRRNGLYADGHVDQLPENLTPLY